MQYEQLLRDAYEWWEYLISHAENSRLLKKYYPNEPNGYPRFFMDTDKLRIYCLEKGIQLPISDQNVQVSDTTEDHSSNADGVQKILSDFGKRISGEAKSKTPLTEEAFKEELEKQYPLEAMKPNRFRQQGANWSFAHYITPLLQELEEAKKSQLDTVKKQWGIFK